MNEQSVALEVMGSTKALNDWPMAQEYILSEVGLLGTRMLSVCRLLCTYLATYRF